MQERAQRTRERVLLAAAAVFEGRGYAAATLEDIVQEARLTKGALYFHFASKAELAKAIISAHHAAWGELVAASKQWELDGLGRLGRLVHEVGRNYQQNVVARAGVRLGNEHKLIDAPMPRFFVGWNGQVTQMLVEGQQDGSVRADLDVGATARWFVASYYGIEEVSARLTERADLLERLDEWWVFVARAVGTADVAASASP